MDVLFADGLQSPAAVAVFVKVFVLHIAKDPTKQNK